MLPRMPSDPPRPDLPRRIGVFGAACVMIGIIIGSGIFRTPPEIARHLGSPAVILLFWLGGGLLALCGALTYAELAAMIPQSGGVYVFIREGFGRCAAFVFGWTYMLVMKPLGAAGIAVVFGEHVLRLCGVSIDHDHPDWRVQAVTVAMLTLVTVINIRGVRLGTGFAVVLTLFKFAAVAAIMILPLVLGKGDAANLRAGPAPGSLLDAVVPVMAAVMWTYDGWSDVGAIAGEVEHPGKNLPRVYLLGTLAVIGLYLAVNASYMAVIPLEQMRRMDTIAPAMLDRLVGPAAGTVAAAVIVISTLGATHGSIMTGARVTFQQSRDGLLFRFLSGVHRAYQTPAVSLWVQLGFSIVAVAFLRTFERLAGGYVFLMWVFFGLAACAVFVLRVRRPDAPRPYRAWGYPVVPALFVLAAAGMTVLSVREQPHDTLMWLGIIAAGVPAFFAWERTTTRARPTPG
jgi:amino acid transporter